jgi:hypothetical protein
VNLCLQRLEQTLLLFSFLLLNSQLLFSTQERLNDRMLLVQVLRLLLGRFKFEVTVNCGIKLIDFLGLLANQQRVLLKFKLARRLLRHLGEILNYL